MDAPQDPRWLDAEERQAWLALANFDSEGRQLKSLQAARR